MEIKTFDAKQFWEVMKQLFPKLNLNEIKEDSKQWTMTKKPVVIRSPF